MPLVPLSRQVRCACGAVLGVRDEGRVVFGKVYVEAPVRVRCRRCKRESCWGPLPPPPPRAA